MNKDDFRKEIACDSLVSFIEMQKRKIEEEENNNCTMKDPVSSLQILHDIQTAWNTLNPQLIIKHLDKSFVYDSQWVLESLDYEGYISYLTGKFDTIKKTGSIVEASIVDGAVRLNQNGSIAFYRVKIKDGKIIKGDLCMF